MVSQKSPKTIEKQSKISISGGANGYGSLAVRWGRPGEGVSSNAESLKNHWKTKGLACALAPFLLRHCLAPTVSRMRPQLFKMHQKALENKAKPVNLQGRGSYGFLEKSRFPCLLRFPGNCTKIPYTDRPSLSLAHSYIYNYIHCIE